MLILFTNGRNLLVPVTAVGRRWGSLEQSGASMALWQFLDTLYAPVMIKTVHVLQVVSNYHRPTLSLKLT